jgi:RimJ/RimL family protein N-acetyltransferase
MIPPNVIAGPRLDLVLVTVEQLLSRDPDSDAAPVPLAFDDPDDVLNPVRSALLFRIAQVRQDPDVNPWLIRIAVDRATGTIVGNAGFHDRPDASGMVEIGYTVLPAHRRRGYGREIAHTLWTWAAAQPEVTTLRASVSPTNTASRRIIEGAGLRHAGEQMDPEDGLEWVYELPAGLLRSLDA